MHSANTQRSASGPPQTAPGLAVYPGLSPVDRGFGPPRTGTGLAVPGYGVPGTDRPPAAQNPVQSTNKRRETEMKIDLEELMFAASMVLGVGMIFAALAMVVTS